MVFPSGAPFGTVPPMTEDPRLRQRLDALEARQKLNDATDQALEMAQRDRLPLDRALASVLPLLCSHTGAVAAWICTYDESLRLREFHFGDGVPLSGEAILAATEQGGALSRRVGDRYVVAQRLDVAGESFGAAATVFDAETFSAERIPLYQSLLDTWCEELDNYLAAIALSRTKHDVTTQLSEALREPLVDVGVQRAIDVLRRHVAFDDMLLVFRHEDDLHGASLRYKIIQRGQLTHDSRTPDMEVDEFLREHAAPLLRGESRALLERFGLDQGREEVLIAGVRDQRVVGRVVVTSRMGEFATFDRDLLERFADYLRQRIVDFNREWKQLSHVFSPVHVRRLLEEEDYVERYLRPRDMMAAILFTDISGFTRISEQVLKEPAKIGELINRWGRAVVAIVWEEGGVFDKMVGDCVIAFWGPPFDDLTPTEACRRAASAARRIRDLTRTLNQGNLVPELAGVRPEVGVATGLSWTRVSVGLFGPDEDYTAFSSGMNNTARLQGVATCDEILCTEDFVDAYGDLEAFGPERHAQVKNVAEPLRFRAMR